MSRLNNRFGPNWQAAWQFRRVLAGQTYKYTDDLGAKQRGSPLLQPFPIQADSRIGFELGIPAIGMGSEIIGGDGPEIIGQTHRDHRLAPRSSVSPPHLWKTGIVPRLPRITRRHEPVRIAANGTEIIGPNR
jgi:hypothetical protein